MRIQGSLSPNPRTLHLAGGDATVVVGGARRVRCSPGERRAATLAATIRMVRPRGITPRPLGATFTGDRVSRSPTVRGGGGVALLGGRTAEATTT